MGEPVRLGRTALQNLAKGPWTEIWIASPRLDRSAVDALLPMLGREGVTVRVLTWLSPARLADGEVHLEAVQSLRDLPGCEVRSVEGLAAAACVAGPNGPALVGMPLTAETLDSLQGLGVLLPESGAVVRELAGWWETARPLTETAWADLVVETSRRQEARTVRDEIIRLGAFVRVTTHGSRRSRRLDPREFGAPEGDWGRVVRPAEVSLYKLDEVRQAKDDLDALLDEHGLEWNGYYLVPRHFLEKDWPRLFAAREQKLRERLTSSEGKAVLQAQLVQARRELEGWFGELYPRIAEAGPDGATWVELQVNRVLTEAQDESILAESGLEYRVLSILPEDAQSLEEFQRLLQDPKLRSVQLTFQF